MIAAAAVVAAIVASWLAASNAGEDADATPADQSTVPAADATAHIRVDQVGYIADESKTAFVIATSELPDAEFTLTDADGTPVATGALGPSRGEWNAQYPSVQTIDFSDVTEPGDYTLSLAGASAPDVGVRIDSASALLSPLLAQNVQFFQAQRDGADVIASVQGREPSHLGDRTASVYEAPVITDDEVLAEPLVPTGVTIDAEGGWFDAGDFLKFTGTTAYATADLLLALRAETEAGTQPTPGLADEAQHGLAWLAKMWDPSTGVLYAQVGTGVGSDDVLSDHDVWRLPEADDAIGAAPGEPEWWIAHRPVFAANEQGEPVPPNLAGRVTAAFALASQTTQDEQEARAWLDLAASIYDAADRSDNPTLIAAYPAEFYPEDSGDDDMEFAAAELALAATQLGDDRAAQWQADGMDWAERYLDGDAQGTLELGDVSALGHADLIALGIALGNPAADDLIADLRRQLDEGLATADQDPFAAGASQTEFDSVPHALGLATTALLYAQLTGDDSYGAFATQQRSWVFGANAWGSSFVIGAGAVSPLCPEHQVANLGDGGPLVGAVVNGPNAAELLDDINGFDTMRPCESAGPEGAPFADFDGRGARYVDAVGAWQTDEPALDFTSTATYALALFAIYDAQ